MRLFNKLFGKQNASQGVVGVSFLPQGLAVAISRYAENSKPRLIYCEFFRLTEHNDLYSLLGKLYFQLKLSNFECHVILTSEEYRRINIEAPTVSNEELPAAIRWKIADLIDFPIENAVVDYFNTPVSTRAANRKYLDIIISPKDNIELKANSCTKIGLNLKVIDIQETSLRNLATLLPENKRGVAILHLQEHFGTILIQKDATIFLSRQLDVGYRKLNLDFESNDAEDASSEQSNLALEIQRSLDYVESYYGIPPISSLVVIPIDNYTQALLNMLNNHHSITARIMDISAVIDCDILLDDSTQSLCAPVIGATLRYALNSA